MCVDHQLVVCWKWKLKRKREDEVNVSSRDDQLFAAVNINGFDTGLAFYFTAPSTFEIKDNLTLHFNRSFLLLKTRFKRIAILLYDNHYYMYCT